MMRAHGRITPLLELDKEGNAKGPMSPVMLAQNVAQEMGMPPFNAVLRVWWDDPQAFQVNEAGNEWTGMDCLVVGLVHSDRNRCRLFLLVDGGSRATFIAHAWCHKDDVNVEVIDGYEDRVINMLGSISEPNRARSVRHWPDQQAIIEMMVDAADVARREAVMKN